MKYLIVFIFLSSSLISFAQIEQLKKAQDTRKKYFPKPKITRGDLNFVPYVNPFIGTGGHGHTFPGATVPFGLMQLSPDSRYDGWDGCSGYHYSDSIIYGFSHTHLSGTGVSDYGDLLVVPQLGKPKTVAKYEHKNGYGNEFSHDNEIAEAGYYEVKFNNGIQIRLSTTERAGMHEYIFPEGKETKSILLDLSHRDEVLETSFSLIDDKTIEGTRISKAWTVEQHFYFSSQFSVNPEKVKWADKSKRKLLLIFPKGTGKILYRVGMSNVDVDGARKNLQKEIPHWDFNFVKASAQKKWREQLNKIEFYGSKDEMTNFYTALYHSCIAPNIFNDVDGRYRGRDMQIHQLEKGQEQYTVFSLWDTYRATHPLYTIIEQERTNQFIQTFLRQYDQGGDLPVWELAANETECMIGFHSASVIADAYAKEIRDFDIKKASQAMIATSNFDEFGKRAFNNGVISIDDEPESVSKTLEYAYDNFCVSDFLKRTADIEPKNAELVSEYDKRALHFVNSFDPNTGFMRTRDNLRWHSPFSPEEVNFNFTEANSWQYSLYAPQAMPTLTKLIGGKDALETWLDRLFTASSKTSGRHQVDITGLIGQYAHGNEPSHHMAYLYNYTNTPHKSQKRVKEILETQYWNEPDGLSGNEDCGQMSSWYVLSSLGFYPIAPGLPYYDFGFPILNKAKINLENGKSVSLKTTHLVENPQYIEKVLVNGKEYKKRFIEHKLLMSGPEIEFVLSNDPNNFKNHEMYQRSQFSDSKFAPIPFVQTDKKSFVDSLEIDFASVFPEETKIFYQVDNGNSKQFEKPFFVHSTTKISAYSERNSVKSSTLSSIFQKIDTNVQLTLNCNYYDQYAAGGDLALIDGAKGGNEYRSGVWQGYYNQDGDFLIEFNEARKVDSISVGFLADVRSWIFYPENVEVSYSTDGKKFTKLPKYVFDTEKIHLHQKEFMDVHFATNSTEKVKVIRVFVKEFGAIPNWHPGKGKPSFFFMDEIGVK